jgi:glycosyltransferase involved in cell wall biosynthesis
MSYPLAIFAPSIGARSETFIKRHMRDLLPGGTVVVAITNEEASRATWNVDSPVLTLDRFRYTGPRRQLAQYLVKTLTMGAVDPETVAVRRFLRRHRVQVILTEWLEQGLPWIELAQDLGLRFFGRAHGYDVTERRISDPKWQSEYLKYNQVEGVITMSHASRARLLRLGLNDDKVHVIPYGVDVPCTPLGRTEKDLVRCVAVGRMVGKKAPILMLDAFRRAAEANPRLRLDYIGDGLLFGAAKQFVQAMRLGDRVTLHGPQPNEVVQRLLREADIFLQHSITDPDTGDEEGLPVVILEAMAHSLPVVSTLHAGIPEAVVNDVNGYLVEEGDSAGMAERLITLARSSELRRRMGEAGWRLAMERFSWERERMTLLQTLSLENDGKLSGRRRGIFCGAKYKGGA